MSGAPSRVIVKLSRLARRLLLSLAQPKAHPTSLHSFLQAAHPAGTHWNYGFRGDDWEGLDASHSSWTCLTATSQSPINLVTRSTGLRGVPALRTSWLYEATPSDGSNIQVRHTFTSGA